MSTVQYFWKQTFLSDLKTNSKKQTTTLDRNSKDWTFVYVYFAF